MLATSFKLLIIFFMLSSQALASRIYLMAGAGLNSTLYHPVGTPQSLGGGMNVKTDLGYNLTDQLSLEWSSQVKLNLVKDIQVWDTLLTLGLRYAFPYTNYYVRGAFGRSPTVFFTEGNPAVVTNSDASRVQLNGPVYGLSLGRYYRSQRNRIWYGEVGLTFQHLDEEIGLKTVRDVPIEIYRDTSRDAFLYSIYFVVGMRVF